MLQPQHIMPQNINSDIKVMSDLEIRFQNIDRGGYNILIHKSIDSLYTGCSDSLLKYSGLNEDQIIGYSDENLPWRDYATIYHKHTLDTLAGIYYNAIVPSKNAKNEKFLFLDKKAKKFDENGKLVGIITLATEIVDPEVLDLHSLLKNVNHDPYSYFSVRDVFLSNRENECLFYLLRGKTAKKIAKILCISPKTAEHHIKNIKIKFNCETKSDLIDIAIEKGFMNVIPKSIFSKQLSCILKERD